MLDDDTIVSLEMDWPAFCDRTRERLFRGFRDLATPPIVPAYLVPSAKTDAFQAAAFSGLILRAAAARRWPERMRVGICGFDLPGKLHTLMLQSLLSDRLADIQVYGAEPGMLDAFPGLTPTRCDHWRAAYADADIFIACSASPFPYIDTLPKAGSVHLNLTLRDYFPSVLKSFGVIGVDQWTDAGRIHGDVELADGDYNLNFGQVVQLPELIDDDFWSCLPPSDTVVFNPIGREERNGRVIP